MRMILALNNKNIEEKLKNLYYSKHEIFVIETKNNILNYITENEEIIIIRKNNDDIEFKELINNIKNKNSKIRIIVLLKELSQNLKEFLFSKEVFNIIEGNEFIFDDLIDLIENPKMIVYKEKQNLDSKNKVICVTGSRGVGKTITALILGKIIASRYNKKVLVLDLDLLNPTMDTYLNMNKNYSLPDYINDVINNKLKNISNYESSDLRHNNLKYILNSKSIGIPNNDKLLKLIDSLKPFYDYIIIDTSTLMLNKIYNLAKEKNFNIVHVIEPGKRQIKNFKMDTIYVEKEMLSKSIIICNKSNWINNFKKCSKEYNMFISGFIINCNWLKYRNNIKYVVRHNLSIVLKEIGIIRFEKFKLKIVNKILNLGDDKR